MAMHHDPRSLVAAVAKAAKNELDISRADDRLMMQRGCYILNYWNLGPRYRFDLYVRGPYSSELAEDCDELGSFNGLDTDVPDCEVSKLSEIFYEGSGYVDAYATVLLVKNNNPGASSDRILMRCQELKPHLSLELGVAATDLLKLKSECSYA